MKYTELSANTGAFIGCRHRLTIILSSAIETFKIGGGYGQGWLREFVNDTDGPAFLERELVGLGVDGRSEFTTVQVEQCPFTRFERI